MTGNNGKKTSYNLIYIAKYASYDPTLPLAY